MAAVRNRMVKAKKKKNSGKVGSGNRATKKSRGAAGLDSRVTGFNLASFSNDVLTHRNAEGLTQRQLGAKTGVTSACVVHIENQKSSPLAANFAKICQYFRLNPNDYIAIKK